MCTDVPSKIQYFHSTASTEWRGRKKIVLRKYFIFDQTHPENVKQLWDNIDTDEENTSWFTQYFSSFFMYLMEEPNNEKQDYK